MSSVNIRSEALLESAEAAEWYESRCSGLGVEFVLELDAAIARAAEFPTLYALQHHEARRVLLRRFPYAVYFIYENKTIEIFAIVHQHGEPAEWQGRVYRA